SAKRTSSMTSPHPGKNTIVAAAVSLGLAVMIGAFGAHGLEKSVEPKLLQTFETGVRYHFYHGFGLLFLGLFQGQFPAAKTRLIFFAFLVGTLLFSFNCYFYVLSGVKTFAMVVPLG